MQKKKTFFFLNDSFYASLSSTDSIITLIHLASTSKQSTPTPRALPPRLTREKNEKLRENSIPLHTEERPKFGGWAESGCGRLCLRLILCNPHDGCSSWVLRHLHSLSTELPSRLQRIVGLEHQLYFGLWTNCDAGGDLVDDKK